MSPRGATGRRPDRGAPGATTDILWEIGEHLMLKSGGSAFDLAYENTIHCCIYSFLGTLTGSILTATILRPSDTRDREPFGWRREG